MVAEIEIPKSNILITLVGTSPMPNLLALGTRVISGGKAYLINTKETAEIARQLCNIVEKKNKNIELELTELTSYDEPLEVYNNLKLIIDKIFIKEDIVNKHLLVELNYTGGTKVMSSLSCDIFIDICHKNGIIGKLTYFDGEKSQVIIKDTSGKIYLNEYAKVDETFSIGLSDVIRIHYRNDLNVEGDNIDNNNSMAFEKELYNMVRSNINNRNNMIEFLNKLYEITKLNNTRFKEELINIIDEFKLKIIGLEANEQVFKCLCNYGGRELKQIKKHLGGFWFESIVDETMLKMKNEGIIDDAISNISNNEKNTYFEVDAAAMKNHRIYFISITTCNKESENLMKLYEIKLRTELLGGDEAHSVFITFYNDTEKLYKKIRNVWDKSNLSNISIIGWNDIGNLYDRLISIIGGVK